MNIQDSRILITGGVGFIGYHLSEKLLERGCNVTIYDNFDDFYPGKEENAKSLESNAGSAFRILRGDINDIDSLSGAVKHCDVIFHLAAQAGIRYCNEQPLKANRVNVDGTLNVLTAARENKVKKIVYASSSSLFGDPVYLPIDEKHPTNPNSPYGVSKLAAEYYCKVFSRIYGMNISCLRYFSVYGPRGRPDQVIYAFAEKITSGKQPIIYGDGEQTRDFTFVTDAVDATIRAMERDEADNEVFNIGRGSRFTINELSTKVISGLHAESVSPIHLEKSKGDFPDTEANSDKAKKLLGWEPQVGLDEGLKISLDWFTKEHSRK